MNIQISHRNALEEKEKSRLDLDSLEPSDEDALGDIEGVEDEDMVVVLGKGDHITLAGDLQTATAGDLIKYTYEARQLLGQNMISTFKYLDMGALELCKKIAIVGEDCHVEPEFR